MDEVIGQGENEEPEGAEDLAAAVGLAFEGFFGEEAFQDVLAEGGEEAVANFEDVVDHVELDGSLASDAVVHSAGVEVHQDDAA